MTTVKTSQPAGKDAKTKQSTLMGFFGKPKAGPPPSWPSSAAPTRTNGPTSSPASTSLRTPSSVAGSSPADQRSLNGAAEREKVRASSPLKRDEIPARPMGGAVADNDVDMDEPDSPPIGRRRVKRKMNYVESESESEDDLFAQRSSGSKAKPKGGRAKRISRITSDDDDVFELDDADDAAFAEAAAEQESFAISDNDDDDPPPTRSRNTTKSSVKKKSSTFLAPASAPARPGPRPLSNSNQRSASNSVTNLSTQEMFLTNAEIRKERVKAANSEAESVFPFLRNVKDKNGRAVGDPDYDPRTLKITKAELNELKPFERQFWNLKQDHFDTVLFFQKGKFYELYEDDASIGHQEFDLKLTERVRMRMVGVPEQSFEYWAAKFLAAGHKVGRVDQAETAIGAEMRRGGKGAVSKGDEDGEGKGEKIVRRELKQIFTNGTIVDGAYLTTDEANHCVAIKEYCAGDGQTSSFGICVLDASTGEFNLTAFSDDVCRTQLETMFRQIRPTELVYARGNLTVNTTRALRNFLPSSTVWQPFQDETEFYPADTTIQRLGELFETESDEPGSKPELPEAIETMLDNALAMEALGGMLFYLQSLNLDKDLFTQRNFNIYDPLKEGKSLVLDGQTLQHMEVLVNNEGGKEGTLLELLGNCVTPFGKRLFRQWLTNPLRDIDGINARLDAVDDLMGHHSFIGEFTQFSKSIPDLERLASRIHAGSIKESDFARVINAFVAIKNAITDLGKEADRFQSRSVVNLLRSAPDLKPHLDAIQARFHEERTEKTMSLLPTPGADDECDEADARVEDVKEALQKILNTAKTTFRNKDVVYWHSAQGGKEIYQLQLPADARVPANWTKSSATKNFSRYYTPETIPLVRQFQEAKEIQTNAKKTFFYRLLREFDQDRTVWLHAVKVVAELDCLVSLAKASSALDQPRCRPQFVASDSAFIDFTELRHPSMCLRSEFIANDVALGGPSQASLSDSIEGDGQTSSQARQVLLTGPNMAGKSTLLRMTAAGIIMAQMGCHVPASKAVLSPVDKIQTRMGAYDNMFASASTFKVELDECSKILREAGPKSFVILDELGRGTSTYDGMAIASAVLHHLATHTLPLGFFATHYGSLTDDFAYHPNIRRMHMQTHVDDEQRQVVFLYKLIPGVAESSHGTHVARLAGVSEEVVVRADQVSAEFFDAFKTKLASKRRSDLPLVAMADLAWLFKATNTTSAPMAQDSAPLGEMGCTGAGDVNGQGANAMNARSLGKQLDVIRRAIGRYEIR